MTNSPTERNGEDDPESELPDAVENPGEQTWNHPAPHPDGCECWFCEEEASDDE